MEEKECRFCHSPLEDWRAQIAETAPSTGKGKPIMAVVFQGKTVKVPVCTGPDGVAEFKRTVCKLFNLPEGTDFEVTFECKSPVFGDKLQLKGFNCFEAASYCAAVSAAKRASSKAAAAAAAAAAKEAGAPSKSSKRHHHRSSTAAAPTAQEAASGPSGSSNASAGDGTGAPAVLGSRSSHGGSDGTSGGGAAGTTAALSRRQEAAGTGGSRKSSSASNALHSMVSFFKRLAA